MTWVLAIESSHKRGMGHCYRAIHIYRYLLQKGEKCVVLLNRDEASEKILKESEIFFEVVKYYDWETRWEQEIVNRYHVKIWLWDRCDLPRVT